MSRFDRIQSRQRVVMSLEKLERRLLLSAVFSGGVELTTGSANVNDSLFPADMDGDGDLDVVTISWFEDEIALYENLGAGVFGPEQVVATGVDGPSSIYAADLDGDGDLDVLATSWHAGTVVWFENQGDGTLGSAQSVATGVDGPGSVTAEDLDGDGDADVVCTSSYGGFVAWYENLGGTFGAQNLLTSAAVGACSVSIADVDGDGDPDVLSASENDDKIAWYENTGGGTFGAQQVIAVSADKPICVGSGDLDGDGDIDVLSASFNDDKVAWYENLGGGAFGGENVITTSADGAWYVSASDLDLDGDVDVLSVSIYDDKVACYENLGGGAFGAQAIITQSMSEPRQVLAPDLDGDGDPDVLAASSGDRAAVWFENLGALSASFTDGTATVSFYDTAGQMDTPADDLDVKFGKNPGEVKKVQFGGDQGMDGLGIVIDGATGVGAVKDARKNPADIAFFLSDAPVKALQLKSGIAGANLNGLTMGGMALPADIDGDGDVGDSLAASIDGSVGKVQAATTVTGDVLVKGADARGYATKAVQVKNGGFHGDMVLAGDVGKVQFGGDFGSSLKVAGALKMLDIKNGSAAGDVSTTGDLCKLSVKGGDLTADLVVGGGLKVLQVNAMRDKATKQLVGGNMTDADIAVAGELKTVKLSGDLTDGHLDADALAKVIVKGEISATGGGCYIRAATGSFGVKDATDRLLVDSPEGEWFDGLHAYIE